MCTLSGRSTRMRLALGLGLGIGLGLRLELGFDAGLSGRRMPNYQANSSLCHSHSHSHTHTIPAC